jgi:hypothetical protein
METVSQFCLRLAGEVQEYLPPCEATGDSRSMLDPSKAKSVCPMPTSHALGFQGPGLWSAGSGPQSPSAGAPLLPVRDKSFSEALGGARMHGGSGYEEHGR